MEVDEKPAKSKPKASKIKDETDDEDSAPVVIKKRPITKKPALPDSDSEEVVAADTNAKAKKRKRYASRSCSYKQHANSLHSSSGSDDDALDSKTAKKPKATIKSSQPSVADLFGGASKAKPTVKPRVPSSTAATARKASGSKKPVVNDDEESDDDFLIVDEKTTKKKKPANKIDDSEDSDDVMEIRAKPASLPARGAPKRVATTATKKYADAFDSDDNDDSIFVDDD